MTWQVVSADLDHAPPLAAILSDWKDETDRMPRLHSRADDLAFVTGLVSTGRALTLLDEAKRHHDRLGLWVFEANSRAVKFYRREGFVEDGRTPGNNAEQLPDIRLVWLKSEEPADVRA
ncbi:MAG: hypothetical protein KJO42_13785 [Silicimonas sp.]|nr:hypothetical protein [Silicimonas sp.]